MIIDNNIRAPPKYFIPSPLFGKGGNAYGNDFGQKLSIACETQITKNTKVPAKNMIDKIIQGLIRSET